jgi:hypothetical protein
LAKQVPSLQFLQPHGHIRPRNAKALNDVIGAKRPFGNEQDSVDLANRSVDAPSAAHFAKMLHEGFTERREVHRGISVLSGISEI